MDEKRDDDGFDYSGHDPTLLGGELGRRAWRLLVHSLNQALVNPSPPEAPPGVFNGLMLLMLRDGKIRAVPWTNAGGQRALTAELLKHCYQQQPLAVVAVLQHRDRVLGITIRPDGESRTVALIQPPLPLLPGQKVQPEELSDAETLEHLHQLGPHLPHWADVPTERTSALSFEQVIAACEEILPYVQNEDERFAAIAAPGELGSLRWMYKSPETVLFDGSVRSFEHVIGPVGSDENLVLLFGGARWIFNTFPTPEVGQVAHVLEFSTEMHSSTRAVWVRPFDSERWGRWSDELIAQTERAAPNGGMGLVGEA